MSNRWIDKDLDSLLCVSVPRSDQVTETYLSFFVAHEKKMRLCENKKASFLFFPGFFLQEDEEVTLWLNLESVDTLKKAFWNTRDFLFGLSQHVPVFMKN